MKMSGRILAFAMLIFLTGTASTKAENWAILIGVNDYNEATDLRYCVADQLGLQKHLVKCGFNEDNIYIYKTGAENPNRLPTHANIKKQIRIILNNLEKGDVVVFGFSGHGIRIGNEDYLCPSDADLKDLDTLVSLDYVYKSLKESEASMKMLLIDACKNQIHIDKDGNAKTRDAVGFTKNSNAKAFGLNKETVPKGIFMMSSCTAGQASYESPKFGHGVWMHFVLEGLRGQADANNDNKVTLVEIADYTNSKTKKYVFNEFNGEQKPWSEVSGENSAFKFNIADITNYVPEESYPATGVGAAAPVKPKLSEAFNTSIKSVMAASSLDERIKLLNLIIFDTERNDDEKKVAKGMRMKLYSIRGKEGDLAKAFQDAEDIGKTGLPVIAPDNLELFYTEDGKTLKSKVKKESVLIISKHETRYKDYPNGLFWVKEVDSDSKIHGWIEAEKITANGKQLTVASDKVVQGGNAKGASDDYIEYDPLQGLTQRDIDNAVRTEKRAIADVERELNRIGNGYTPAEKRYLRQELEAAKRQLQQEEAELRRFQRQQQRGGLGGGGGGIFGGGGGIFGGGQ